MVGWSSNISLISEWVSESHSVVPGSLWPHRLHSLWNSLGQNTGMGSLSLLHGIFPTQGSNPGLLHCRQILYQLSHKRSPRTLEWVAFHFSSRSSWPRNQTGVSCIAGKFFTHWGLSLTSLSTSMGKVSVPGTLGAVTLPKQAGVLSTRKFLPTYLRQKVIVLWKWFHLERFESCWVYLTRAICCWPAFLQQVQGLLLTHSPWSLTFSKQQPEHIHLPQIM